MATYYIDPDLGTGTGDGSIGDPFADTTEATMGTSNTFLFKYGTTHTIATRLFNAQLGEGTILGAYGDSSLGRPILINSTGEFVITIRVSVGANQTISDLEITGSTSAGETNILIDDPGFTYTTDRGITIDNCVVHDAASHNLKIFASGVTVQNSTFYDADIDNIYFEGKNNLFDNLHCYTPNRVSPGDNIQGEAVSGAGGNNVIQNCLLDKSGTTNKQNIKLENGVGNIIRDTVCIGVAAGGFGITLADAAHIYGNTITGGRMQIAMLTGASGCLVEQNKCIADSYTDRGIDIEEDSCTVRSNIVDFSNASITADAGGIFSYNNNGAKIQNNTIIGHSSHEGIMARSLITNQEVTNNIVTGAGFGLSIDTNNVTETYNILFNNGIDVFNQGSSSVPPDTTDLTSDPQLTDYKPAASSPAFAAGKIIFGARDYNGRPYKYPPTIGAYEFNAGAPAQTRSVATKPIVVAKQGEFTSGPNICLQSESFTTSPWSAGPNTTYTANAGTAPDGANTATDVLHNDNNEWTLQNITVSAGKVYTASVYIHSGDTGTHDWVNLWYVDQASAHGIQAWYNLTTGSVGTSQTVGFNATLKNAIMTDEGDGWYRISITGQLAPGETGGRIVIGNVEADASLVEDAAASVWYWGAQLELGYRHHPYLKTTTVAVSGEFPRDAWDVLMYSGSIVQDADGTYRMMYTGYQSDGLAYGPCIATSTDLVNWTKPNLGLISYGGNTNNNIIIVHSTHIGADLAYLDSQYVALIDSGPSNLIYTSPDGVNFTYQIIPFSDASYGSNIEAKAIIKVNGVYRIYYTAGHAAERRTVGYYESSTLTGTYVDQGDISEFTSTSQDLQYYDFKPFYYDNSWWAVVNIFNKTTELLGPHLLYRSEDLGATWKEYSTLVALGSSGTFDDELMATGRPVLMDGTWYYLYVGSQDGHDDWPRSMSWGYATGAERTTTRTVRS